MENLEKIIVYNAGEDSELTALINSIGTRRGLIVSSKHHFAKKLGHRISNRTGVICEFMEVLNYKGLDSMDIKSNHILNKVTEHGQIEVLIVIGHEIDQYHLPIKIIKKIKNETSGIPFGYGVSTKPGCATEYNILTGVCSRLN